MRRLFTLLLSIAILLSLFQIFFSNERDEANNDEIEEEEHINEEQNIAETEWNENFDEDVTIYAEDGFVKWIGKDRETVLNYFGEPSRMDLSPYGYEWYIFHDHDFYLQMAMKGDKVVSLFTNDENAPLGDIKIGDPYDKADQLFSFSSNVSLHYDGSTFQFELNNEEKRMRPLTKYGDFWIQFYFDVIEDKLSSIRILDDETLILQQPYSLVYRGTLPELPLLSDDDWEKIQIGNAKQVFELTNMIRKKHGLPLLQWDEKTADVAFLHSEDMYHNEYFSHTSPHNGDLQDRLEAAQVYFQFAGENIAANYVDGIAAVEGWLNSEGHRVNLLNETFTHLGVGVYRDYYTQNFVTPW